MSRQSLPDGYGVIEASNDRYYPAYVLSFGRDEGMPQCSALSPQSIPYLPPCSDEHESVSFPHRTDAVAYCQHQEEYDRLSSAWEQQANACELHPCRNAWYQEEIIQLIQTHGWVPFQQVRFSFHPYADEVCAWVTCSLKGTYETIDVRAETIDLAWESLYQKVYERLRGDAYP